MILLDAPYVSEFLVNSAKELGQPVLDTLQARELSQGVELPFFDEAELSARIAAGERIYSNSENSLDTVIRAAGDSDLARYIEICKDKALFREVTASIYPDYFFQRVKLDEMDELDIASIPKPFIIKPARGFFSLGVHPVFTDADWPGVVAAIKEETATMNAEYPSEVVNAGEFIIEQMLEGEEFAVDTYFDADGKPVIINILYHQFASADDVGDRLYYTSPAIMERMLPIMQKSLEDIAGVTGFRNYPIHLEVRMDEGGNVVPIEANPLRFGGWCVGDMTHHAWGFNPYEYYLENKRPDWDSILESRKGRVCSMVIGDMPPEVDRAAITGVDYDGFANLFDEMLELRKIDYSAWPLFAFAYAATTEDRLDQLKAILQADFTQFITTR